MGKGKEGEKRRAIGGTIPQTSDFFTNSFMRLHLPHFFQKENNNHSKPSIGKKLHNERFRFLFFGRGKKAGRGFL
jgi:hypothetical protein